MQGEAQEVIERAKKMHHENLRAMVKLSEPELDLTRVFKDYHHSKVAHSD